MRVQYLLIKNIELFSSLTAFVLSFARFSDMFSTSPRFPFFHFSHSPSRFSSSRLWNIFFHKVGQMFACAFSIIRSCSFSALPDHHKCRKSFNISRTIALNIGYGVCMHFDHVGIESGSVQFVFQRIPFRRHTSAVTAFGMIEFDKRRFIANHAVEQNRSIGGDT